MSEVLARFHFGSIWVLRRVKWAAGAADMVVWCDLRLSLRSSLSLSLSLSLPQATIYAYGTLQDECTICLDMLEDAVQTVCSHIYCSEWRNHTM
jgi:hypothetical protein